MVSKQQQSEPQEECGAGGKSLAGLVAPPSLLLLNSGSKAKRSAQKDGKPLINRNVAKPRHGKGIPRVLQHGIVLIPAGLRPSHPESPRPTELEQN